MIRNLKALGLAALAMLALGATATPAAQAETDAALLTAGTTEPAEHTATPIHATQVDKGSITENNFVFPGLGRFHCSNASSTFTGTASGTDSEVTITPSYAHCTTVTASDTAGTPVTITTNGCDYTFTEPHTIEGGKYTGDVDLECPAGKAIEFEMYAAGTVTAHNTKICTISVSPAEGLSHVIYENANGVAHADITITAAVAGLSYATSGLCGVKSSENGSYSSTLTLTSNTDDLWISDEIDA